MQAQGPYLIDPGQLPGSYNFEVPVNVGPGSYVELINLSAYDLHIRIDRGDFTMPARKQWLIPMSESAYGQQQMNITPINQYVPVNPDANNVFAQINTAVNTLQPILWVNVYQQGEIEPYPPIDLGQAVGWPQGPLQLASAQAATGNPLTLTVPPNVSLPSYQNVYIFGFDLTATQPTAAFQTPNIQIANLFGGTANYALGAQGATAANGQIPGLFPRFNPPIWGKNGQSVVFSLPSLNSAIDLNVWYALGGI